MNPAIFPQANLMYGENQPQFLLLPAHHDNGVTTVCFEMTAEEFEAISVNRKVWIQLKTDTAGPGPIPALRVFAVCPVP